MNSECKMNSAVLPTPKLEDDFYDWWERHAAVLRMKNAIDPEIVLIGDSITHLWGGEPAANLRNGAKAFASVFAPYRVLNLGFGWERTQNVLWRLDNGELDGIEPKLVVILIGTNNTWGEEVPVEDNVRGIKLVTGLVLRKLPRTKVLLLALFPREDPNTNGKWKKVNQKLASEKFGPRVTYLDIGGKFLDENGKIARGFAGDKLHLSAAGYQIWAEAIMPKVVEALGK